MKRHLSELRIQELAFGNLGVLEAGGARAHLRRCRRCATQYEDYRAARSRLDALGELTRVEAVRPGLAGRVLARLQEANAAPSSPWLGSLLQVARIEIPVMAALSAALLVAGTWQIRHENASKSGRLAGGGELRAEEQAVFWPEGSSDESWARWAFSETEEETDG